jgi:hypothetical protein
MFTLPVLATLELFVQPKFKVTVPLPVGVGA